MRVVAVSLFNDDFYPCSPCGERPGRRRSRTKPCTFLSMLSLRRATSANAKLLLQLTFLSMLSLRRATKRFLHHYRPVNNFYPCSPCGERRHRKAISAIVSGHFYPCSPCGERRWHGGAGVGKKVISIHALLAESDPVQVVVKIGQRQFLSMLSLRRATVANTPPLPAICDFYPCSPCGERPPHTQHLHCL